MESNSLESQIKSAGRNYTRKHDIAYRTGLILQVIGLAVFLAGFLFNFNILVGLLIFEAGVLLSAFFLLVWITTVKKFIIVSATIGVLLQIIAALATPFQPITFVIGVGFVCIGAAGLVGKETYCSRHKEGYAIMALYPVLILLNLIQVQQKVVLGILYTVFVLLYTSFLRKKLSTRLLQPCEGGVCKLPKENEN